MRSSTSTSDPRARSGPASVAAFVAAIAGTLLLLELLMRVLPVSSSTATGYWFDPNILTYPAHHEFRTASGWNLANAHRHRSNNTGFLDARDFVADPAAVALVGDSFTESSMLAAVDRLGPQLERAVGRPVYALGAPGTSLLDYAERIRFASQRFGIRDFVLVLEKGDLAQSLCGSGNVAAACLDRDTLEPRTVKQAEPGLLKRIARESAFAQYLFSQLKIDPAGYVRQLRAAMSPAAPADGPRQDPSVASPAAAERIVETFFARVRPYRGGRLVLVLLPEWNDAMRAVLTSAAAREGAIVVDASAPLAAFGERTGLSTFVSPHDHHLNPAALGVVAASVAPVLAAVAPAESRDAQSAATASAAPRD